MLKVFSCFSGIGAFEKALSNLQIPHEVVYWSEIDTYAIKAYSQIHQVPVDRNLGDICKVDETTLGDFDLMTYGFPCQDISICGNKKGIIAGETRSGLLHEVLRIAKHKTPKYLIAENVKNLMSKKFKHSFDALLIELDEMGYNNYHTVLNTLDFNQPIYRERVFIVSIRKDVDRHYSFPEGLTAITKLSDIIEDDVPEKYYLSEKMIQCLERHKTQQSLKGNSFGWNRITKDNAYVRSLKANYFKIQGDADFIQDEKGVRKLTPKEFWLIMGFNEDDVSRCSNISDTQLYKLIGNSIGVGVLQEILRKLLL